MEGTVPPWVPWRRLHRLRVGSRQRDDYWFGPRLNIYTGRYQRPGDTVPRHIIRFEDGMGSRIIIPTPANPWLQQQYPLDTEPWRLPVPLPPDLKQVPFRQDPMSVEAESEAPPPAARHHWTDSALGWAAGTVLLAMFVLIVRAAEKCLDRKLFKIRRRQSEEWPTPNVLATSHQHSGTDPDTTQPESFSQAIDLPPPYSECAGPKPSIQCEDPPPPYSDCYVSFVNPKDGIPSARIIRRGEEDNANIGSQESPNTSQVDLRANASQVGEENIGSNTDETQSANDVGANSSNESQDNANVVPQISVGANTNDTNANTSRDCVININERDTSLQV